MNSDPKETGEFGLIETLVKRRPPRSSLYRPCRVAAGDDAALLAWLAQPVITTDTQREGVHFRRDWQTPFEIGYKAVSVTLSDLAASFAKPVALFVNLGLPPKLPGAVAEELYDGLGAALKRYGCDLGGGNTSQSSELSLDLFAVGEGQGRMPRRSDAQPGDLLCVTGPLGLARAGLRCLETEETRFPELLKAFKEPEARFDAAEVLRKHRVRCAMDISDGLAGDAGHLARESGVSLEFHLTEEMAGGALAAWCGATGEDPLSYMASGGEEYELLFACNPDTLAAIEAELPGVMCVGRVMARSGSPLSGLPEDASSFEHR
ncbi:thiamine-phosphate kinase [Desulfoluna spongiiphila]|uniref:Thiamine-monophosphate kinase n=1 Tax=Desulfoluna spongiiphila TaxID=419481 RepID=A0A1G5CKS2_9BACT|nr:thiamine-phosphate kinase [Desulfoluna spongiiphila]SCY03002.1 thiamine-monophosphate kinase [Desulfoluna spongiiphila]